MATLWEIRQDYYKLMDKIQEQGGELLEEDIAELEKISEDKTEKYESYCKMIQMLLSDAEPYKAEKQRFAEKQASAERTAQRLKERLAVAMTEAGEDKYKTPLFQLSFRNSQAVQIDDESVIPDEFKKWEYKLDKMGIKEQLKNGNAVAGASLVTNTSLQIK